MALARKSLETFVSEGKRIEIPSDLSKEMKENRAEFCVNKEEWPARGCIGTIAPTEKILLQKLSIMP